MSENRRRLSIEMAALVVALPWMISGCGAQEVCPDNVDPLCETCDCDSLEREASSFNAGQWVTKPGYAFNWYNLGGLQLKVIRTPASNIELRYLGGPLAAQPRYGINGGFFAWGSPPRCLSMAVNNDAPVRPEAHRNDGTARGTLVYDAVLRRCSVQVVRSKQELQVGDRSWYWAQGGISMRLGDAAWHEQAVGRELLPGGNSGYPNRAGAAYDNAGNIYLAVTTTPCTPTAFRGALRQALPQIVDGIFLDGSGSAQMRSGVYNYRGSDGGIGRTISNMIALKKS